MTVTVRFAPSPTGLLQVGNFRAALINWLFARKAGGRFLVRIDDTDPERSKEDYVTRIFADLGWLGLTHDDTFRQSARFDRYDAVAAQLKDSGRLYPCYETEEELSLKRKRQLAAGRPPIYDRSALKLTDDDRTRLEAEGRRPHWRFKLDHTAIDWADLAGGDIHFEGATLSDPVLIREDGSYLYSLPSVIDDVDYAITHVIRGNDHISNTATQIQMFEALGATPPAFAHLPLLTDPEGGKLSKRLGSLNVDGLRDDMGLESLTVVAYLARLGSSEDIEAVTALQPLIDSFDIGKFSRSSPKFDPADLKRLNAKILHALPYEAVAEQLTALGCAGADQAFWETVRPNLETLADIKSWWAITHAPIETAAAADDQPFLADAARLLPDGTVTEATWDPWIAALKSETGRKGKALFMPLRKALTGQEHGPEMRHLLPLLGRERILRRLG